MPAQTANGGTAPVGGDGWNLVPDMKKLAETLRVLIPAADQTARDALAAGFPGGVLPVPTMCFRLDLARAEVWDGIAWKSFGAAIGSGPYAMAAGTSTFSVTGTGGSLAVSFPAGRFTVPPIIVLGKAMSGAGKMVFYAVNSATTGFTLGAQTADGSSVSSLGVACQWTAIQMTPTNGAG
uniref:hypothetical protein n=1 Tax=Arthrobacter silvisoli TaxID=2291022 RepID=UPI003F49ACBF